MENGRHSAAWRLGAACRNENSELFFPEGSGLRVAEQEGVAKRICSRCLVRPQCLTWALTAPEADGIWGGTTPSERRLLRAAEEHLSPCGHHDGFAEHHGGGALASR